MSDSDIRTDSKVCRCFRTRMMFLPEQEADRYTYGFTLNDAGHAWCQKTLRVMGPDDGLVEHDKCGPERGCYQGF